ncbi:Lrp/AsnC family transcriptional regulator [Candidatus Woesearchaeota archaeon]|nr:Lrp/AsnC family transcriptional regulator [Candidatus Woesearchaeota archaeon]
MGLDTKDFAILGALRLDARMPIRDIAKKTGLRPSTVHQRLVKLKSEKVIEAFTIKANNAAVGEGFIVFMLIKTKPQAVVNSIIHNEHVKEVFGVTGEYDVLVKMKFSDVAAFNDFLLKFRKHENVEATLTMVATASIKEEI